MTSDELRKIREQALKVEMAGVALVELLAKHRGDEEFQFEVGQLAAEASAGVRHAREIASLGAAMAPRVADGAAV